MEWNDQISLPEFAGGPRQMESVELSAPSSSMIIASSVASQAERMHSQIGQALEQEIRAVPDSGAFTAQARTASVSNRRLGPVVGSSVVPGSESERGAGDDRLRLYLSRPTDEGELRRSMARHLDLVELEDPELEIDPVITGEITALSHNFRLRPAAGGVSVGHSRITAGTLGCLARGRSGDRRDRVLILSNNHVLADENRGSFGDPILQPGDHDSGTAADQIAALERHVRLDFSGGNNVLDCATAWADPTLVRPELFFSEHGKPRYFNVSDQPAPCRTGMPVAKTGRTTGLTQGRIRACNATFQVRFGSRVVVFSKQIEIIGRDGVFSAGGDSGSLIWSDEAARRPVGLLFAGGGGVTFANPIDQVLDALDIDLLTR
ncbi:MAG: hypothetical protein AAGN46_04665 [Acidobacteriota bacterium]